MNADGRDATIERRFAVVLGVNVFIFAYFLTPRAGWCEEAAARAEVLSSVNVPSVDLPSNDPLPRHLSLQLIATNWSWGVLHEVTSFISPGGTLAFDWHLLRYFSMGALVSSYVVFDSGGNSDPVLMHNRLGLVPKVYIPVRDKLVFTVGMAVGGDLGVFLSDRSVAGGLFGVGVVGFRFFVENWGITFDVQSGFDCLWETESLDVLFTLVQVSLGAVYRF